MSVKKPQQNKEIVLLRHAKSSWDDPLLDDFDRPLAKRGRKAAKQIGEWLKQRGIEPALVLCSASERTRETLDLVLPALKADPVIVYERRLYLADASDLLDRLHEIADDVPSVLMVGHNPGMQDLALALAPKRMRRERRRLAEKFPTAAVAWFRTGAKHWSDIKPNETELLAYVRPADLKD